MTFRRTSALFGIPIDLLTMEQTVDAIFSFIALYKKDKKPRYVATLNLDFLNQALGWSYNSIRNPKLLSALRRADLITADGMPLLWTSKAIGETIPERVTGADLVPLLVFRASISGKSIFLLGGSVEITHQAALNLQELYPSLHIAGIATPEIELLDTESLVAQINTAKPDILFINLGNPKQELWFDRNKHRLCVPVSIGVGGVFSFLAKRVKRAPVLMQNMGLEWSYRMFQEPGRLWKRYSVDALKFVSMIIPLLGYHYWSKIFSKRRSFLISQGDHEIILDFTGIERLDPSDIGVLIHLLNEAKSDGKRVKWVGLSPRARRLLKVNRVWDLVQEIVA